MCRSNAVRGPTGTVTTSSPPGAMQRRHAVARSRAGSSTCSSTSLQTASLAQPTSSGGTSGVRRRSSLEEPGLRHLLPGDADTLGAQLDAGELGVAATARRNDASRSPWPLPMSSARAGTPSALLRRGRSARVGTPARGCRSRHPRIAPMRVPVVDARRATAVERGRRPRPGSRRRDRAPSVAPRRSRGR